MTRARFSPLRLIEAWDALYWETNQEHFSDEASVVVPKRTRVAWWCQARIETATAIWQVLSNENAFPDSGDDLSRAERAFLKTKAILCLLIGRDGGELDGNAGYARGLNALVVCDYHFEEFETSNGPGGSCDQVEVGHGYLKHWYAFIERESWP